ncbi:BZ3500_MvSof-1268-A1-R1_Chr10-4g03098 [Microbotryum saponariae]|uniref:BZ3500_MvSof-1268-A1-R1_Chr10-4g03098 protein n=1 Tax=Microbotryum saponariae TaxID=289078 RepID=A0A2X0KZX1_9BASI|nr:BZ3501_MvSof-1269-A2-R1_Chr10-2g02673 [Microbotryum saponariae]SDA01143.1 BZ3500_MvSof-1268-A1-R1_Chr10-4g03098 [Microbotryum saponariae]
MGADSHDRSAAHCRRPPPCTLLFVVTPTTTSNCFISKQVSHSELQIPRPLGRASGRVAWSITVPHLGEHGPGTLEWQRRFLASTEGVTILRSSSGIRGAHTFHKRREEDLEFAAADSAKKRAAGKVGMAKRKADTSRYDPVARPKGTKRTPGLKRNRKKGHYPKQVEATHRRAEGGYAKILKKVCEGTTKLKVHIARSRQTERHENALEPH